jgi:hypothetical protein
MLVLTGVDRRTSAVPNDRSGSGGCSVWSTDGQVSGSSPPGGFAISGAMRQEPVTLDTIGKLHERGYSLGVYCEPCGRYARLDLDALCDRLGADYPVMGELPVRCSRCSGRKIGFTVAPPDRGPLPHRGPG